MIKNIPFNQIVVGENYSREEVGDVSSLAASIKEHGLQQPMIVDEEYVLVAGFRRHAALASLGYTVEHVDVNVTQSDNPGVINLVENLERKDLTFWEECRAVHRLFDGCSDQEIADSLGVTKGWSRPRNKLWTLPQEIIDMVREGKLTATNIVGILNSSDREEAVEKTKGGEKLTPPSSRPSKSDLQSAITTCLERELLDLAQAFRYCLGDISEEEFWDNVQR